MPLTFTTVGTWEQALEEDAEGVMVAIIEAASRCLLGTGATVL